MTWHNLSQILWETSLPLASFCLHGPEQSRKPGCGTGMLGHPLGAHSWQILPCPLPTHGTHPLGSTPALVKSSSLDVLQRFSFLKENVFLYNYKNNMQPHKEEIHTALSLDFFLSCLLHLHIIFF